MRAGSHGDDMLSQCKARGIASITYDAILDTDLSNLEKNDVDHNVKGPARHSIWNFAWEILAGDVIYVGDSITKSIVARGYVKGNAGVRAYRFNDVDPVREPSNPSTAWKHEVPVKWDSSFVPFRYNESKPRFTLTEFDPKLFSRIAPSTGTNPNTLETDPDDFFLDEDSYQRETSESKKNINRLHSALSNRFKRWLKSNHGIRASQEVRRADMRFDHGGHVHLAELKICYGRNTKHAIREALGQLFEYNHYPKNVPAHSWWLVLDQEPTDQDKSYISFLSNEYKIPISLVWPDGVGFQSSRSF